MSSDPLTITVLDLDAALGGNADLMLGGGFGLTSVQTGTQRGKKKPRETTEDSAGFQIKFQFTKLLLCRLSQASPSRILQGLS